MKSTLNFLLKIILLSILPMGFSLRAEQKGSLVAGENGSSTQTFDILYPTGTDEISFTFAQNESSLREMIETIRKMIAGESTYIIDSVVITGSASPLGGEKLNSELSRKRAETLSGYVKQHSEVADSLLRIRSTGANWPQLRRLVESSSMQYKTEVLQVIDRVPVNQKRNKVLMELKWGKPYLEMMETFFPKLQNASTVVIYSTKQIEKPEAFNEAENELNNEPENIPEVVAPETTPTAEVTISEPEVVKQPELKPEPEMSKIATPAEKQPLLNISTNALYWFALAPNIGIEYCFPQGHWSLNGEFVQPWWKNNSKHKYYQIRQFSGEPRYWLKGDGDYRGHFFGAYGHGGVYDLENGGPGYKGHFWGGGATYGYVLKLRPRFRMEFSIGVGYLSTTYEQYVPIDKHYVYEKKVSVGYVGPTKVKVGLVWTIFQRSKSGQR
ncbi:MAG: DUF3575 domain-containing protein [Bacteroidales bacterium]